MKTIRCAWLWGAVWLLTGCTIVMQEPPLEYRDAESRHIAINVGPFFKNDDPAPAVALPTTAPTKEAVPPPSPPPDSDVECPPYTALEFRDLPLIGTIDQETVTSSADMEVVLVSHIHALTEYVDREKRRQQRHYQDYRSRCR